MTRCLPRLHRLTPPKTHPWLHARTRLWLLMVSSVPLSCWMPLETGRRMQSDLRHIQEALEQAQQGISAQQSALDEQMQRADKKIGEVELALQDLNRAARNSDAEFGMKLERLIREVQELRGATELNDFRVSKLEGKGEAGRAEAAASASPHGRTAPGHDASPDNNAASTKGEAHPAKASESPTAAPAKNNVPTDKKGMLEYAAKLQNSGQWGEARGIYRDVIRQWPRELGTTDEAYLRLGETYFDEKNYPAAAQEFIKVVEKFSGSKWVADAYYKIGLCSTELGNLEDALIFYNEILSNHKKSPLVSKARQKRDEVQKRLDHEKEASKKTKSKSQKTGAK